ISGVNGVFKKMNEQLEGTDDKDDERFKETFQFFDQEKLDQLRERQIDTVRYLDQEVFPKLYDMVPDNTWIIVTADHGELFGEEGYFGHGPIMHEKCFEVPYLEGKIR
ncbi:MAG TPA: metalloenzyme, partial [Planctomycetaceae bacterium]|nr:metalloenzyme [Planctomycetaceae bacterium]